MIQYFSEGGVVLVLQHSSASHLSLSDYDIRTAQALLRQSDVQVTKFFSYKRHLSWPGFLSQSEYP